MGPAVESIFGDAAEGRAGGHTRVSSDEAATLQAVGDLALSQLSAAGLSSAIVEDLNRRFTLRSCSVWLVDDERGVLTMTAQVGFESPLGQVALDGASDATRAVATARRVVNEDTSSPGTPSATRAVMDLLGPEPKSYVALPLIAKSRAVGVLILIWPAPRTFSEHELALLETMAGSLALGLRNALLTDQLTVSSRRLEAHISNSPLAVVEFDGAFHIIRWSSEAERMFGYSADEVLGLAITQLRWIYEEDMQLVDAESARLYSGKTPRSKHVNRNYRKDGSVIWCEWYSSAIYDGEGALVSVLSLVSDVTEVYEAARLREAGTTIDRLLHSTLRLDEVVNQAVSLGTAALGAEVGAVCMPEGDTVRVAYTVGLPADAEVGCLRPDQLSVGMQAIDDREMVVVEDACADPRVSPELRGKWGIQSFVVAPLICRDRPIGVLYLGHLARKHHYSQAELGFIERLATSLSLALQNAQLFEAEHNLAETLQETLVAMPASVSGVRFSRSYQSATAEIGRVGGDFVDLFEARGSIVGFAVGDVSGKGIDAAVVTSLVRNALRVHAVDGLSPVEVCRKTNEAVLRFTCVETFVTLLFGLLDTQTGLLRYVRAGHPAAFVLTDADVHEAQMTSDPILGALGEVRFAGGEMVVAPGERLVLYSDGVTEARSLQGAFLGVGGAEEMLRRNLSVETGSLADRLMDEVDGFASGVFRDDAAILVIEPTDIKRP